MPSHRAIDKLESARRDVIKWEKGCCQPDWANDKLPSRSPRSSTMESHLATDNLNSNGSSVLRDGVRQSCSVACKTSCLLFAPPL